MRKEVSCIVSACMLKHAEKHIGIHQGGVVPVALEVFLLNAFAIELPAGASDAKRHGGGNTAPDGAGHAGEHLRAPDETGKNLVEEIGPVKRAGDSAECATHQDQGSDSFRVVPVVLEGDLNTHRVRGDDRALEVELVADGSEVPREILDRQSVAIDWWATSAVSAKMPVDHTVPSSEQRGEITPSKSVAADAIGQDERRRAFTRLFEEEACPIPCFDKAFAVVLHARGAYFFVGSSGLSGMSLTEGSLRISGRAIFTQR